MVTGSIGARTSGMRDLDKRVETSDSRLYYENGKENGNYYLGFRV